jgi:hypothetical protein
MKLGRSSRRDSVTLFVVITVELGLMQSLLMVNSYHSRDAQGARRYITVQESAKRRSGRFIKRVVFHHLIDIKYI